MKFEIYPDSPNGLSAAATLFGAVQWRWRLKADNGRIIANGGESFHNEADCRHSVSLVQGTNSFTPIIKVSA